MFTALPATGTDDALDVGALVAIGGIELMPAIPGVTETPEPKSTVGRAVGAGDEQPASSRTAPVATTNAREGVIRTPIDTAAGYTA
jgi:hypothetical protein